MPFEVGVVARFRARHHLVGDFGLASEPHEHEYRVDARVRGADLQPDGTLLDITALQNALNVAIRPLENRDLNEVAGLAQPNPSAEVVARYVCEQIAPLLDVESVTVTVWESDDAYAAYTKSRR